MNDLERAKRTLNCPWFQKEELGMELPKGRRAQCISGCVQEPACEPYAVDSGIVAPLLGMLSTEELRALGYWLASPHFEGVPTGVTV